LNTHQQGSRFSSRSCISFFLTFHCLLLSQPLLYPDMMLQPSVTLYIVLAVGSVASISVFHKPSSSFLIFMLSNILVTWQADHLAGVLAPHLPAPYCAPDTILLVWQVGYFVPALLLKTGRDFQAELQAFFWEDLSLRIILKGGAVSLSIWHTPLVIGSFGLFSLCCMSIKYKSSRTYLLLCLVLLLSVLTSTRQVKPDQVSQLSWSDYQAGCLADKLTAGEQATCHHFTGLTVEWTGVVDRVRILQRKNHMENMISFLPEVLRQKTNVKCLLGDEFGSCESKTSKVAKMLCKTRTQPELENEQRCHLERYSEYQYQVVLTMPAPLFGTSRIVVLAVEDLHRNTVMTIKAGQKVRAVGMLAHGTLREEVHLYVRKIKVDFVE